MVAALTEQQTVSQTTPETKTVLLPGNTSVAVVESADKQVVSLSSDTHTVEVATDIQVVVESNVIRVVTVGEAGPPGAPGTSGLAYVNATPMAITVGGAVPGTTFSTTVEDALNTILYPYQTPAFSSFGFTQTSPLEVGDTVAAGSKSFTWTFTNASNITANTMNITDVTASIPLAVNISNTSPVAIIIGPATSVTAASHTWSCSATNTQAATFSSTFTVSWQWRTCYGESALTTLTSADILALRVTGLASTINGTKAFVGGGYKWICYPTTFGLKTTFKDTATNLDVAMVGAATVPVTNTFGVTQVYYAHRTLNILGGAINIAVS